MSKLYTCAIIGDEPKFLPWRFNENLISCDMFKKDLTQILRGAIDYGVKIFLVSLLEGFELLATELLLELKKEYQFIKIFAILPHPNFNSATTKSNKIRFQKVLKQCDNKIFISKSKSSTDSLNRDFYMIQHSSIVITCYSGQLCRTKYFVQEAFKSGLKIRIIRP